MKPTVPLFDIFKIEHFSTCHDACSNKGYKGATVLLVNDLEHKVQRHSKVYFFYLISCTNLDVFQAELEISRAIFIFINIHAIYMKHAENNDLESLRGGSTFALCSVFTELSSLRRQRLLV